MSTLLATTPAAERRPGRVGSAHLRRAPATAIVGRHDELARLMEALRNPSAIVLVGGESGVGKSRLVAELAQAPDLADRRVLVGRCHPSSQPFPFGAVVEALGTVGEAPPGMTLRPLLGALRPLLPEWAERLPPEPARTAAAGAQRHRLFRALRALLVDLGPTLCVLEDLQWADEETLEFLAFLSSSPPAGLALVLTYRTEDRFRAHRTCRSLGELLRPETASIIALEPLSAADVRELVAVRLDTQEVSEDFVTWLHRSTGGMPFAVERVVDDVLEKVGLGAMTRGWSAALGETLPVPAAIREPLLGQLGGLSEMARHVAGAAAIVGEPAEEGLLAEVAGLRRPIAAGGLVEALTADVLRERAEGMYGFRHALACRAVYETISGPRRRRGHERVARMLEKARPAAPVAEIAHHLKRAGDDRWTQYAEAAASEASAAGDDRLAARLLEDVLSAPELPRAARIRMVLALGDAALYCAAPFGAIGILQEALAEETLPTGVRGEMRFSLSRLLGHSGDAAASRAEAVRAVTELRRRPALGVRAMINLAQPGWNGEEGAPGDHRAWLDRAVQTVAGQTDRVAQIAVLAQRAAILLSLGDPSGWAAVREIPGASDVPAEKLQLSRGYRSLAGASLGLGHYARACAFLGQADLLHDQSSNRSWGVWLAEARTALDWCRGRWDGLEGRLRRLQPDTAPIPALALGNQFVRGSLLLAEGRIDEADLVLTAVLEIALSAGDLSQIATVSGRIARLHLHRHEPQAALGAVQGALTQVRCHGLWIPGRTLAPEAVQALLACGERDSAREVVTEFALGLRRRDAPAARAALACCRGALAEADGRQADAARHFARADAGWGRLPNPYEAARARERRALCSVDSDEGSAGDLLLSARRTFDGLGAHGDTRRIGARLKAQGAWRGGRKGYGEALSPREAQVARLAADGLSNRGIAEELCISPRTVEIHVAASLRKLHLRSRHELGEEQRAGTVT